MSRNPTRTVSLTHAKAQLSRLVEEAAGGEGFMITKRGKPIVRVLPLDAPSASAQHRVGFLAGQISVPDDFDTMGQDEILQMFGLEDAAEEPR
jgi:prevent-host-death family protein